MAAANFLIIRVRDNGVMLKHGEYLYNMEREKKGVRYYRCRRKTCYARGIIKADIFERTGENRHNHEEDTVCSIRAQVRQKLIDGARREPETPRMQIYNRVVAEEKRRLRLAYGAEQIAAAIPGFEYVRSSMARSRNGRKKKTRDCDVDEPMQEYEGNDLDVNSSPAASREDTLCSHSDDWRQEEAGPSNVKPPYMLKESKMLVNVAFFVKSLQSLNNHGGDGCNFSDMYITGETTIDCNVGIELSCTICLTTAFVWTDDPGPEFLERHPPKPFIPPPKKTPVIAEKVLPTPAKTTKVKNKVPTKPKRKKTPPPPRLPRVPRLKSIRQDFTDYYTSNSIEYQFPNDVTFIKQEVPEDEANSFLNQLPLLSTQPATVQLLFGVENADDVPQSSDKNVSLSPGPASWNHQTSSVIGLNTGHSVMTSANETIVPDVRPTEALPVDLNLVKAEIQEESQSMEVDNLPSVRILPMSVTSVSRSETAFASESFTKTFKDSTPVATTSVMASTIATESGVPLVSDILSAKGSSVSSSCPTSAITQTMFQHVIPGSTEDFVRQTTNGSSNNNMVNLDGKIKS